MFEDMKPAYFNHSQLRKRENGRLKMELVSNEVGMAVKYEGAKYKDNEKCKYGENYGK
jgi:hypothetical protein